MGCLVPIIGIFCPRLVLFVAWLATDWFSRAYDTTLYPLLGFLFMPVTTLAYMAAMLNNNHEVSGWWFVVMMIAVMLDLASHCDSGMRTVDDSE